MDQKLLGQSVSLQSTRCVVRWSPQGSGCFELHTGSDIIFQLSPTGHCILAEFSA